MDDQKPGDKPADAPIDPLRPDDKPADKPADKPTDDDRLLRDGQVAVSSEYFARLKREREDAQARLRQIEADKDAAEKARLKEQGEFQKLAEAAEKRAIDREAELESLRKSHAAEKIRFTLQSYAAANGIIDPEDVALADASTVTLDDSGQVIGAKEAIDAFKARKPHLFKAGDAPAPRGQIIPNVGGAPTPTGTSAKSMDPMDFKKAMFERFRVTM